MARAGRDEDLAPVAGRADARVGALHERLVVDGELAASEEPALDTALLASLRAHRWQRDWKIP